MFEKDCYYLGYILKHHRFKGDLKIKSNLKITQDICKKWESLFFQIDGILVPFFIEHITLLDAKNLLIKFEDIDDEKSNFKGTHIFVDKADFPDDASASNLELCIGYQVITNTGNLGVISDILEYPAQQMMEVDAEDGKSYLIPANTDWIESIDTEQKQICMHLPDGLLSLNE